MENLHSRFLHEHSPIHLQGNHQLKESPVPIYLCCTLRGKKAVYILHKALHSTKLFRTLFPSTHIFTSECGGPILLLKSSLHNCRYCTVSPTALNNAPQIIASDLSSNPQQLDPQTS